jgi:hypothetical protein
MFFSSNRGRMQRRGNAARRARRRLGSWPAVNWNPRVECLEQRNLLSGLSFKTTDYPVTGAGSLSPLGT